MALAAAAAVARAIASPSFAATGPGASRSALAAFLARRFFFAGFFSAARHRLDLSGAPLSHAVRVLAASGAARIQVRCSMCPCGNDDWPLTYGPRRPLPKKLRMELSAMGVDFEHWRISMDRDGVKDATKQQMIDCSIQILAQFVGGEEEVAKKKIYSIRCDSDSFSFGCQIDEETSEKLKGHPGVVSVIADQYSYKEFQDYGGELFVNGEIVQRPPERQPPKPSWHTIDQTYP